MNEIVQKSAVPERQCILFIHSITGCDTVLRFYGHGKVQLYKKLTAKNSVLKDIFDRYFSLAKIEVTKLIMALSYCNYGDLCLRRSVFSIPTINNLY